MTLCTAICAKRATGFRARFIGRKLRRTANSWLSGLLLDLAHARLAALYRGQGVEEYVAALPLDRVRQVHVSGIREQSGVWHDAHESMQEEDYRLLAWVLDRCAPEMVTLEYFREEGALREQITRLRRLLG